MSAVFEFLLDLLYPPKCPFCGALLEKGELLCPSCQEDLPWLVGEAGERELELTSGCVSALRYEGKVRNAIRGYKFGGRPSRGKTFGALLAQAVRGHDRTADIITWPSLSPKRLRHRGYDQGELLARAAGERLGIPVVRTLEKSHRPAQSGLEDKQAREANLLGAYRAVNTDVFAGKTLLLVDDVVTTGATLTECAKTLRLAGAGRILCAALADAGHGGATKSKGNTGQWRPP